MSLISKTRPLITGRGILNLASRSWRNPTELLERHHKDNYYCQHDLNVCYKHKREPTTKTLSRCFHLNTKTDLPHYITETKCLLTKQHAYQNNYNISTYPDLDLISRGKSHCLVNQRLNSDDHYHKDHHGRYERSSGNKSGKSAKAIVVASLGILGIFKGYPDDRVEKERTRLKDEEKVKKMTPSELLIAKGVLALCDQDHSKAEDLFHKALKLAHDNADDDQEFLVLNLLATNFFEGGDFEKAEKLYIDLIRRLIAKDTDPTDSAILELSLKLASIYSRNETTFEKAQKGFRFVIDSLTTNIQDIVQDLDSIDVNDLSEQKKNDLALLGWSYDWFAKHLIAINDLRGAVKMLQYAFEISAKVLGPLHDQTLILLNDIGTTLAMNNKPETGRNFIERAVEGALQSKSRELASFYVNLGLVNLQLQRFSEAKQFCEYSIELSQNNQDTSNNSSHILAVSRSCLNEVKKLLEVNSHH